MRRLAILGHLGPNDTGTIASLAAIDADAATTSQAVRDHRAMVQVHLITVNDSEEE